MFDLRAAHTEHPVDASQLKQADVVSEQTQAFEVLLTGQVGEVT